MIGGAEATWRDPPEQTKTLRYRVYETLGDVIWFPETRDPQCVVVDDNRKLHKIEGVEESALPGGGKGQSRKEGKEREGLPRTRDRCREAEAGLERSGPAVSGW